MGRKAESGLIITASILAFFVFISFLFYTQISTLQTRIGTLQSENQQLESELNQKNQQAYSLQTQINNLESQVYSLNAEIDRLESLIALYENVPYGYYQTNQFSNHANTVGELEDFLAYEFELPTEYEKGVFDCSESSAYLEWALEDAGFNAWIISGPTPWGGSGYHAWVHVYTTQYTVPIESTALTGGLISKLKYLLFRDAPGIVYSDDEYGQQYYHGYDSRFENIYAAVKDDKSIREWNWWSVLGFP